MGFLFLFLFTIQVQYHKCFIFHSSNRIRHNSTISFISCIEQYGLYSKINTVVRLPIHPMVSMNILFFFVYSILQRETILFTIYQQRQVPVVYSSSKSPEMSSSSAVASWYCWYSETRSFKFDSASVNSISSIPSPVYQ